jgi:hypothetical protein
VTACKGYVSDTADTSRSVSRNVYHGSLSALFPICCQPGTSVYTAHCALYPHVTLGHTITYLGCVYNRST